MALVRLFVVCSIYRCSIKHGKCGWFVAYNEMSIPIDDYLKSSEVVKARLGPLPTAICKVQAGYYRKRKKTY